MAQKKINSLQLLRAIAVSFVIIIHSSYFGIPIISPVNFTETFYNLKSWGAIGVDLFFTISGFIMTIVVPPVAKQGDWKTFFAKRIIRIIPLYYLLSILDALTTIYLQHKTLDFQEVVKSFIFFPVFDKGEFVTPLISVGWSLSYEMYFYTLIGVLLMLKKDIYKRLLIVILIIGTLGLVINTSNPLLRFLTNPMLFEFGFGIICGLLYKKISQGKILIQSKKPVSVILTMGGLALMLATVFLTVKYDIHDSSTIENNNYLAFYRAVIWGIPCALFLLGVTTFELSFSKTVPRLLILAGDASYSCYLIHMQLFKIFAHVFKYLRLTPILFMISVIPLCLLGSIVFYFVIEKPLVTGVDRLFHYRKPVIMS